LYTSSIHNHNEYHVLDIIYEIMGHFVCK